MSLTVNELMKHHTNGTMPSVKLYEDGYFETEIPQFNDITERMDYMEDLKAQADDLNDEIKKEREEYEKLQNIQKNAMKRLEELEKQQSQDQNQDD